MGKANGRYITLALEGIEQILDCPDLEDLGSIMCNDIKASIILWSRKWIDTNQSRIQQNDEGATQSPRWKSTFLDGVGAIAAATTTGTERGRRTQAYSRHTWRSDRWTAS